MGIDNERQSYSEVEQPVSENMGISPTLRRALLLLIIIALVALAFSQSIAWLGAPQLACPQALVNGSAFYLEDAEIHRSDFPPGFVFGAATAAYQVEGAVNSGGRGPSIWDVFAHTPGKILGDDNGDVAVDQYHMYEQDVDLLKTLGMDAYRFSISWSRIMPDGTGPELNEEGIQYYNNLIDALLRRGIQPYVTLYHWDLPLPLYEAFNGWTSKKIVPHFAYYAEVCFERFGDRVKHWLTFNEPMQFTWHGYGGGTHAPGRTSDRSWSPVGNSSTEPYWAAHYVLLSHAAAVDVYRKKFQKQQGGTIGMTVDCEWAEPLTDSPSDLEAAERRRLFQLGWYLDPIFFGDYPAVMRSRVGSRLPTFTEEEKSLLVGSLDFIGLNHYTTRWVTGSAPPNDPSTSNYELDQSIIILDSKNGRSIGPQAYSFWLLEVPWGVERVISWVWNRYRLPIWITENGMDTENQQPYGSPLPVDFARDPERIEFYQSYLRSVRNAIRNGADVRSYFAWSLLDNFEWAYGYSSRFGLYYVDYSTLKRYPKDSAHWFKKFLKPRDYACHSQKNF